MDSDRPAEEAPAFACVPWSNQPLYDFTLYRVSVRFIKLVALFAAWIAALLVVGWIVQPEWRASIKAAVSAVCDQPLVPCPIIDALVENDDDESFEIGGRHLDLAIKFRIRLPDSEPPDDDCDGEDDDCEDSPEEENSPTKVLVWTCPAHYDDCDGDDDCKGERSPALDYIRWNSVRRIMNPTHVPP